MTMANMLSMLGELATMHLIFQMKCLRLRWQKIVNI